MNLAVHPLFKMNIGDIDQLLERISGIFPEINFNFERFYFGSEWCTRLMELPFELLGEECAVTLVTPAAVTNEQISVIDKLIGRLSDYKNVEVVVNDWGLLSFLANKYKYPLIVGRMLVKNKRDNRLQKETLSAAVNHVIQNLAFNDVDWIDFFHDFSVKGVEVDFIPQEIGLLKSEGIEVYIKLPLQMISFGRICFFTDDTNFTLHSNCTKECQRIYLESDEVFQFGKCLLHMMDISKVKSKIEVFDRLVWELFPQRI